MSRKPDHDPDCECCQDGMEAYLKKTEDNIRRFGHSVVGTWIETPDGNVNMAYTVGLADAGLPELIVFGLPPEAATPMLNASAERLRQGTLALDAPVEEIGNLPMVFKAVEPSVAQEHIIQANNRAGRELPAIQMIWPDPKGRFPWDPAFDTRFSLAQPLLFAGHTAPRRAGLH